MCHFGVQHGMEGAQQSTENCIDNQEGHTQGSRGKATFGVVTVAGVEQDGTPLEGAVLE